MGTGNRRSDATSVNVRGRPPIDCSLLAALPYHMFRLEFRLQKYASIITAHLETSKSFLKVKRTRLALAMSRKPRIDKVLRLWARTAWTDSELPSGGLGLDSLYTTDGEATAPKMLVPSGEVKRGTTNNYKPRRNLRFEKMLTIQVADSVQTRVNHLLAATWMKLAESANLTSQRTRGGTWHPQGMHNRLWRS